MDVVLRFDNNKTLNLKKNLRVTSTADPTEFAHGRSRGRPSKVDKIQLLSMFGKKIGSDILSKKIFFIDLYPP